MREYWIWLAARKGMGNKQKLELAARFSDINAMWQAETYEGLTPSAQTSFRDKDLTEARRICAQCDRLGIFVLTADDPQYPNRLRSIADPPLVLYGKGSLPDFDREAAVAVVGTRRASAYGLMAAERMGGELASCGGLVVSGMAAGIDAQAAWGALRAGRPTVAVLGGGVDVIYPASNRTLYRRTEENGCLISEYPPGSRPFPYNFLQRNRIISGLSDGVLVVEAPERSGALNTARHAYSQGRDMFAVPGNLGVDSCLGSNALLQEGAYPALSGWDVVKHYENLYPDAVEKRTVSLQKQSAVPLSKVAQVPAVPQLQRKKMETTPQKSIDKAENSTYSVLNKRAVTLNPEETAVLELLSTHPQYPDAILDRSDLPPATVQAILTRLGIKGLVQYQPDGRISRK